MPAGQTFRLVRAQRQQQRTFDPNLTGLQLTDETALNTAPENPGNGYLQRYRGRPQYAQWPVLSRMQATDLQLADQPLLDLEPWSPPTAAYQRYRGRPQQAQWPVYSRLDATGLEVADQDISITPEYVAPWRRPTLGVQWRQYRPTDLTPFVGGLPDQDINLVPVSARMWRPASRVPFQQAHYFDLGGLALQLADQDVTLVPVSARMWRPASRAPYQQAVYFDLGGLALQLVDQDVTLRPVNARPPRGNGPAAAQWKQFAYTDPSFLTPGLPDQDVTLRPAWALGAAVYAIRKGRQPWQQYTPFDNTGIPSAQDVNLIPSWMVANTWLARRAGRPTWQQFTPTDPSALEVADQDVTLVPSWTALMGGVLARRSGRSERLQPVYHDLAGLGLQLADQDVRLVPVAAPRSTFLRYQGRQLWLVRVLFPSTTAPVIVTDVAAYMAAATERFFDEAGERFQADARDRYTDGGQP